MPPPIEGQVWGGGVVGLGPGPAAWWAASVPSTLSVHPTLQALLQLWWLTFSRGLSSQQYFIHPLSKSLSRHFCRQKGQVASANCGSLPNPTSCLLRLSSGASYIIDRSLQAVYNSVFITHSLEVWEMGCRVVIYKQGN
jgi:hypothetical protein